MPQRAFLICQPDKDVPAGAVDQELSSFSCRSKIIRCDKNQPASFDPEQYAGLIVLGGGNKHADVPQRYVTEKNCIKRAVIHGRPVFGICLGAQLLALQCGGCVGRRSRILDKGWKSVTLTRVGETDPVLKYLRNGKQIFQHHYDYCVFPRTRSVQVLAKSCGAAIQHCEAFRFGNSYGVQFHPEVTAKILSRWRVKDADECLRTGQAMIHAWIRIALGEAGPNHLCS